MSLTFLLGGARSGKSGLAVELARGWEGPVSVVATAEAGDVEMAERIRLHRAERPAHWETIEEPLELGAVLGRLRPESAAIVDCLSLWASNLLARGDGDAEIEALSRSAALLAAGRDSLTVVVSNEVGLGVVPASDVGRRYRDLLGRINAEWAAAADEAAFVVAGKRLPLA